MKRYFNYNKLTIALILVCAAWLLTKIYVNNNHIKNPLLVHLANQEQQVWQQLEQHGINRLAFESKKKDVVANFEAKPVQHTVSPEDTMLLTQTARDFNINPDNFSFEYSNDPAEAATDADTIYINKELFNKLPKPAAKFVLGHELQHLKFQDSIERSILKEMATNIKSESKDGLINNYIRFQETRADINAALKNEEYAKSYLAFTSHIVKTDQSLQNPAYPSDLERLKLAQQTNNFLSTVNGASA